MAKAPISETNGPRTPSHEPAVILDPVLNRMMSLARMAEGKGPRITLQDPAFAHLYPNLFAWLSAIQIGEFYAKDPARLSFQCNGTEWEVALTDNSLLCSLSYPCATFEEALRRLEAGLSDPDAPWRRWKKKGKALRRLEADEENP